MIIGDATIWSAALQGHNQALCSLFTDLRRRGELTAPGLLFAQLLADAHDEAEAERLRQWATEAPPLEEPLQAWLSAGDLAAFLATNGAPIGLIDAYLVTLCIREEARLWSYNPRFNEVARLVPLQRFQPPGLR